MTLGSVPKSSKRAKARGLLAAWAMGPSGSFRSPKVMAGGGPFGLRPVEELARVGTSVDAIPTSDATGIDLRHQAFRVLVRGRNRTDRGAGRAVTMLARDRQQALTN